MITPPISSREWLEADGFGGFASGTAIGIRTRRYHELLLTTTNSPALSRKHDWPVRRFLDCLRENERMRRSEFPSRLHRAADAYIVDGRHGKTIMAGYPWFTYWGRDTFIALRGLCLMP